MKVLNWERAMRMIDERRDHSDHGVGCIHHLTRMSFANGEAVSVVEAAVSQVHMTGLIGNWVTRESSR